MAIESTDNVCMAIATRFERYLTALEREDHEMADIHQERIERLCVEYLPSGGGFNAGTELDLDESKRDRLVFATAFNHLDREGAYNGWTHHKVVITPSIAHGFNMRVTGRNKNGVKDYIYATFNAHLWHRG